MPTVTYFSDDFIFVNGTPASEGYLLGSPAGDGAHLVGQTISIADAPIFISFETDDPDGTFDDDDAGQTMTDTAGTPYPTGEEFEAEYMIVLRDPNTGIDYTAYGISIDGDPQYLSGLSFVGTFPPRDTNLTVISASEGPADGTGPAYEDLLTAFCFTPDTLIATPSGVRPIQSLLAGDLVLTRDNGAQALRWKGATRMSAGQLAQAPHLRPVRIRAGSLGPNLPERDLVVSPDHRILLQGPRPQMLFGTSEVLATAASLIDDRNFLREPEGQPVEYVHLAFETHEIVLGNGLHSESLQPLSPMVDHLQEQTRSELLEIFPHLATGELGRFAQPARRTLTAAEARSLT
ncbi:Hint domain-containing protein [Algicella marina]|uniref:Type I secretion protein n=1 Tax=Algicella marina TaxID=2683284 RepID=A0A6P1SY47_9RHOB|nr:Hint domain-containing protein [Algicella marina]QHQ34677.1 type I secretion protein [Algicella marina]